ncbi:hypothetical protein FACS189494_08050 [Spirochaetia bacterium]|nr:hypothetical protein FACS189494_08050 [Spirochaetia bacterium]
MINSLKESYTKRRTAVWENKPLFPNTIKIEANFSCNYKCIFCPQTKLIDKHGSIDFDLCHRLLLDAYEAGARELTFSTTGEPLLNLQLEEHIAFAKSLGYSYVYINTNGWLATQGRMKSLIDSGLDSIKFSLNAISREEYKTIHGVDGFERVKNNIRTTFEYRNKNSKKCNIYASFVETSQNRNYIGEAVEAMKKITDEVMTFKVTNRGGQISEVENDFYTGNDAFSFKYPCGFPFNTATVTAEGWEIFRNFIEIFYPDVEIISVNPVGLKGMFDDIYTNSCEDGYTKFEKMTLSHLCDKDTYNLLLHKHLGDVFYQIATKQVFENVYQKKLRFIVNPQHEFLMKMQGVTDYIVFDINSWVVNHLPSSKKSSPKTYSEIKEFDRIKYELICRKFRLTPFIGAPFSCDVSKDFSSYDHYWCYWWAKNMGLSEEFKFPMPKYSPQLSSAAKQALREIDVLEKIVLLAPEGKTAKEVAPDFWNIIAERIHAHGYKIIVNSDTYKINHAISTYDINLSLEDVVALGLSCAWVFSLRSGLTDVLVNARDKMYVFYPAFVHHDFNCLNNCFEIKPDVNEIAMWHWKIDPVIWDNEDLTFILQEYIDKQPHTKLNRDLFNQGDLYLENNIQNK